MRHIATITLCQEDDGTFTAIVAEAHRTQILDHWDGPSSVCAKAGADIAYAISSAKASGTHYQEVMTFPLIQVCADCETPALCRQALRDKRIAKCGKMS